MENLNMRKFLKCRVSGSRFQVSSFRFQVVLVLGVLLAWTSVAMGQQLPNAGFEDWSGAPFDGNIQPASWNASNVTQFGLKFNFAYREAGHTGNYCMRVQDRSIGAMGITEVSPGYFSLGKPWVYIESLTAVSSATAGTEGGINWTHRPDSMSVWIKRTGNNWANEDFYLLYYAWSGTGKGSKYKGKNGSCTSVSKTNEESDIRIALDGNECGSDQKGNQIAEGLWRERKEYSNWTNIRVPIYYFNNDVPTMMNIIFSAGNYPNYRANTGLHDGNSLWVDDVELIYSSTIQKIYIDDKEWKGFNPNSTEEQIYSLGQSATTLPKIEAKRGAGTLSNARGESATFAGRTLTGSEITITDGVIDGAPTTITVRAADGSSTTTYKIKFVRAASTNAKLAGLSVNGESLVSFSPNTLNYNVELPYGTTAAPVVAADKAEDAQTVAITQATSTTGTATIKVTAADKKTTSTYTVKFSVAQLSDNTLEGILVNGKSVPGFTPTQTIYRVSLPMNTTTMPTVKGVSKYPAGAQTIQYTAPAQIDGGQYQVAVTTPGNAVAKVYKLNFKLEASSYSYLKDLQMGGYITNFSPEVLTYYVSLPLGTTALPAVTYEQGDEYQTVTVEEGGLDGTTKITVRAANGDETLYKIVVSTAKSEISTLNNIFLDGTPLADFSPDKTQYSVNLPIGTTALPEITVEQGDEFQSVSITPGGLNGVTRILVSAGNGTTTVYQITFSVTQATNSTLKMIYVDGEPLAGYSPEVTEYTVNLPVGTTVQPAVTYDRNDEYQTVTVRAGSGLTDDYKITVRPQSGASRTYVLHFTVATSSNNALAMIYIDDAPLPDFQPDVLRYEYALPVGVSIIPAVRYDKGDASQKVLSVCDGNVQTITVTAENGDKREYVIAFLIQKSENAFLKMIYLDGTPLEGFDKEVLNYTVPLTTPLCPQIAVDKENGQQVMITRPYADGIAAIRVQPEQGEANIYTITFTLAPQATVQLQDIMADGVSLPGFQPQTTRYTYVYEGARPVITWAAQEGQSVQRLQKTDTVILAVSDGNAQTNYRITLRRTLNTNTTLAGILLDGEPMAGFAPGVYDYTLPLPAGSALPVVTYAAGDATQAVFMGQTADTVQTIIVRAESGAEQTYTLRFAVARYDDSTLADLQAEGHTLVFDPQQTEYTLTLDDGAPLPGLAYTAREGQQVTVYEPTNDEQRIAVRAENGAAQTYIIRYAREVSGNALLSDILLDGVSLQGFAPDIFAYVDSLPRRSKVVPSVFAVGQLPNQTITTHHSRVNGTTTIRVAAPDGKSSNDYTIYFPVRQSDNAALEDLFLNSEDVELHFHPDTLHYTVLMPYRATEAPKAVYTKAEDEQVVEITSRPLGDTTEIRVRAEDGTVRRYTILFQKQYSGLPNRLQSLTIAETGESLPVEVLDATVRLPYATRTMSVEYTKAFEEQTVTVQPGGISKPTVITLRSNRPGDEDATYTIVPQVETQNPATLESIVVDGVALADFDRNRFTYICNRTATTTPNVTTRQADGVQLSVLTDVWHWQAQVTAEGQTNTYTVYFHYPNDVIPNGEFDEWAKTGITNTDKPANWFAPGDAVDVYSGLGTAYPGNTVSKESNSVVHIKTEYFSPIAGPVPAIMNLGGIAGNLAVAGGSRLLPYGFISFHNSPDAVEMNYKYTRSAGDGALFRYIFYDMSGGKQIVDHRQSATNSNYASVVLPLTTSDVIGLDIVLDATGRYPDAKQNADLYVDYIRFSYSSALSNIYADGIKATRNGNAFSVMLTDRENTCLPQLTFEGEVADQAQRITWTDKPDAQGCQVREAAIVNYAEDGTYTEYTLEVKRPLDTNRNLANILVDGEPLQGFDENTAAYTVRLAAKQPLPSVQPVLYNGLQSVTNTWSGNVLSIKVTPESGSGRTYKITFVYEPSDDTTLQALTGVPDFEPNTFDYTLSAAQMPDLDFVKAYDAQTVSMTYPAADKALLTVRAENGAEGTYTVRLQPAETATSAQLSEITLNGGLWTDFASDTYEYTTARPSMMTFRRVDDADSVVFVQTSAQMQWRVIGTAAEHTYTLVYSTEKSANTRLKDILLNGTPWADFIPSVSDHTADADTVRTITFVRAEEAQQLAVSFDAQTDTYAVGVTAEDGTAAEYRIRMQHSLSGDATLRGIYINGAPIADFAPDVLQYTVTLPSPQPKQQEPAFPSVTYLCNHPAQSVEMSIGALNASSYLLVTAEDGTVVQYEVRITAEPSHCTALTGILVNGKPLDGFDARRNYYSAMSEDADPAIDWASDDAFQTVTHAVDGTAHTLRVLAQDGINENSYTIDIYAQALSDNATLAGILLDGMAFSEFEPAINPRLAFSPMQQGYTINLPAGAAGLPDVTASLMEEGQTVSTRVDGMTLYIEVTAPDGKTTNTYVLAFSVPLSANADLAMLYIDGDTLADFAPGTYYYQVALPVGVHAMPEVVAQKAENTQTVTYDRHDDAADPYVSIAVLAENGTTTATYTVAFRYTLSAADTLAMLYADGMPLPDFAPDRFTYAYTLPVGTTAFPELTWDAADRWQTVRLDTLGATATGLTRSITATAENGRANTYTVHYDLTLSSADTLRMIYVDDRPLEGFRADSTDYVCLYDDVLPKVTYTEGDEGQTVVVTTAQASPLSNDSVVRIEVIAANGNTRLYTLHFSRRLSSDAHLEMIYIAGDPLANFDAERYTYRIPLPVEMTTLPMVTVEQGHEAQQVEIRSEADTVTVRVIAEDLSEQTYTLVFEHLKSDNTLLADITLQTADDTALPLSPAFVPDHYDYLITIPYGISDLPAILPVKSEEEQTVEISDPQPAGTGGAARQETVTVTVTAPNGEDMAAYTLTFVFARNSDAALTEILVRNEPLPGFHADTLDYMLTYPVRSTEADFAAPEDVQATASDPLATVEKSMDADGTLILSVTAQDGTNRTYTIRQTVELDTDNTLRMIYLDDVPLESFDPAQDFYTYYLVEGMTAPVVTAEAESDLAEVSIKEVSAGDTCIVICTAETGEMRRYRIWFAVSETNEAARPTPNDVLLKRINGSYQMLAATTRKDVSIVVYNMQGKRLFFGKVPTADPNDVICAQDSSGADVLMDVNGTDSGVLIDLHPNDIYYYTFFVSDKEVIKSGKVMLL